MHVLLWNQSTNGAKFDMFTLYDLLTHVSETLYHITKSQFSLNKTTAPLWLFAQRLSRDIPFFAAAAYTDSCSTGQYFCPGFPRDH